MSWIRRGRPFFASKVFVDRPSQSHLGLTCTKNSGIDRACDLHTLSSFHLPLLLCSRRKLRRKRQAVLAMIACSRCQARYSALSLIGAHAARAAGPNTFNVSQDRGTLASNTYLMISISHCREPNRRPQSVLGWRWRWSRPCMR